MNARVIFIGYALAFCAAGALQSAAAPAQLPAKNPVYYLIAFVVLGNGRELADEVARIEYYRDNLAECKAQRNWAIEEKIWWSKSPKFRVRYVCMTATQWNSFTWPKPAK